MVRYPLSFTRPRMTTPQINPARALLAHGEHEWRCLLRHALQRASYDVIACRRPIDFLARIGMAGEYGLIVCDVQWLDELSVHVIRGLPHDQKCPPLLLIDAADEPSSARLAQLQPVVVIGQPREVMRHVAYMHALRGQTNS